MAVRKKTYPWTRADLQAWQAMAPNLGTTEKRGLLAGTTYGPGEPQHDEVTPNYLDPTYLGQMPGVVLPYNQALGRLPGNLETAGKDWGFTYKYEPGAAPATPGPGDDPNDPKFLAAPGSVSDVQFDTSNPYSRAALLQRSYDQTKQGNTTGYAARGQLYSGALQNAQATAGTNFDTGKEGLTRGFRDMVSGWLTGPGGLSDLYGNIGAGRAGLLGGVTQHSVDNPPPRTFGGSPGAPGVAYEPNDQGFLAPLPGQKPTAKSALGARSLLGSALDPTSPLYRPYKPPKKRKP